jgi:ApbE superfamily uncharacterized protein (UPF0280 family)
VSARGRARDREEVHGVTLLRRKPKTFDIQVQDFTIRITAAPDLVDESRAAALTFWEQLQSYSLQHPEFRSSKRPLAVPEHGPALVREMVAAASNAGVGPMFAFRGAVTDSVGRFLARQASDLTVECGGDLFILRKKRTKLVVHGRESGSPVSVVVEPRSGGTGISTATGRGRSGASPDGLAVIASSCMLADAAAAGVHALLAKPDGLRAALQYLEGVPDVQGGVVVQGERIGVAGRVEIAS